MATDSSTGLVPSFFETTTSGFRTQILVDTGKEEFRIYKEVTDRLNQYLEPIGKVIKGITFGTQNIVTRIHQWVISYKTTKEGGPNGTPPNGNLPIGEPLYTPAKGTLPYGTIPIGTPANGTPLENSKGYMKFLQWMGL